MPMQDPLSGDSLGFHLYATTSEESTLADPETIVWSSIQHLCSREVAESIGRAVHGLTRKRELESAARNVPIYVKHAFEFHQAAKDAKPNTSPLLYYYSFLNLAKALCEFRNPGLHRRQENYRHGISWRPNKNYVVYPPSEFVSLSTRGIWHLLWEAITRRPCPAANPQKISIHQLFRYCPEVTMEVERAFGSDLRVLTILNPDVVHSENLSEAGIKLEFERSDLRSFRLSGNSITSYLSGADYSFHEVHSNAPTNRSFETRFTTVTSNYDDIINQAAKKISNMNLFCYLLDPKELQYGIPLQANLPFALPQIIVLYTILFWLGSLVRYDPHSVEALMDSRFWLPIDGFLTQSRLWLLELMEWELYQAETLLWSSR